MKKIGIYGGSFNPITYGHTDVVKNIITKNLVDEIWIMPCAKNNKKNLVEGFHRLKMLELAISDFNNNNIKIFDYEIKNNLPNRTLNTIKLLKSDKEYKDHKYYFIVGMDVANDISNWHNYQELINLIKFIVLPRNNQVIIDDWFLNSPKHIYLNDASIREVSSTLFRETFDRNVIHSSVLNYILVNNLYKNVI